MTAVHPSAAPAPDTAFGKLRPPLEQYALLLRARIEAAARRAGLADETRSDTRASASTLYSPPPKPSSSAGPSLYAGVFGPDVALERKSNAEYRLEPKTPREKRSRSDTHPASARLAHSASSPQLSSPRRAGRADDLHSHSPHALLEREAAYVSPTKRRRLPDQRSAGPSPGMRPRPPYAFPQPATTVSMASPTVRLPNGHPASSLAQDLGLGGASGVPLFSQHARISSIPALSGPGRDEIDDAAATMMSLSGSPTCTRPSEAEYARRRAHIPQTLLSFRDEAKTQPPVHAELALEPPAKLSTDHSPPQMAVSDIRSPPRTPPATKRSPASEPRGRDLLRRVPEAHVPTSHSRHASTTTPPPPPMPAKFPATPKTLNPHFSYGEYLNMSPSPQPVRSPHTATVWAGRLPPVCPRRIPPHSAPPRIRHFRNRSDGEAYKHGRPLWAQPLHEAPHS